MQKKKKKKKVYNGNGGGSESKIRKVRKKRRRRKKNFEEKESMNVSLEEIPQLREAQELAGDNKLHGWAYIKPRERNMVTRRVREPKTHSILLFT